MVAFWKPKVGLAKVAPARRRERERASSFDVIDEQAKSWDEKSSLSAVLTSLPSVSVVYRLVALEGIWRRRWCLAKLSIYYSPNRAQRNKLKISSIAIRQRRISSINRSPDHIDNIC